MDDWVWICIITLYALNLLVYLYALNVSKRVDLLNDRLDSIWRLIRNATLIRYDSKSCDHSCDSISYGDFLKYCNKSWKEVFGTNDGESSETKDKDN